MSRNFELLSRATNSPVLEVPPTDSKHIGAAPNGFSSNQGARAAVLFDTTRAFKILRRNWRLSVSLAAAVALTVTIATLLMKPVYEPVARMVIDPPGTEAFTMENGNSEADGTEYLETNAQLLRSDELAIGVIRALHLDQNKELVGDRKPEAISSTTKPNTDVTTRLSPAENIALRTFQSRLKVKRDSSSRLVNVSYASHDPRLSAAVVNTLLQLFIEKSYKTRLAAIQESTEWLSRQLDDIRKRMEDSNRALAEFERARGIAELDDNKNTFSEQLAELNRQRTQAAVERIRLSSVLNNVTDDSLDTLPEVHANQVIQTLTQKLAEVRAELAQSLVIYGKNHPNVKRLRSQADELDLQINKQRTSVLGELKNSYSASQARERAISREAEITTKNLNQMAQYSALKKEAQAASELYNALYRRIKEAGISAGSKSNGIRIMDAARILDRPTRPNRLLNIALGLLAGLVGGIAIAFLKDNLDNRIHTPEDIMSLGTSSAISIIPTITSNGNGLPGRSRLLSGTSRLLLGGRHTVSAPQKFLLERPISPEAEALRGLQTSLMLSRLGRSPQALLVTSSLAGEGKTTLAINLALAMSQHGTTCLVEADMRKTGVSSIFGLRAESGLSEVLAGVIPLNEVLLDAPNIPNLTILPAGPVSTRFELVGSESMREKVRQLRNSFTFVLIDSPPVLPYADARVLSTLVDGVVFVARCGITTREAIERSIALLAGVHAAPIMEIVLNAAEYVSPQYAYY